MPLPDPNVAPFLVAAATIGYLLGSIPFGLILTRLAGFGDIRQIGSGNIGATNVLRTGRRGLAALTLFLDGAKGAAAVLIALPFGQAPALAAGCAAFAGHLFPVWLGFRGGKGVSTYLGVLAALSWPAGIGFAVIWVATARLTRISSLSALAASLVTPAALLLLGQAATAVVFVVLTAILWLRHAANIRRLSAGDEPHIGEQR
jgi:glycerol-3-phosphate acyltransferase PlsY